MGPGPFFVGEGRGGEPAGGDVLCHGIGKRQHKILRAAVHLDLRQCLAGIKGLVEQVLHIVFGAQGVGHFFGAEGVARHAIHGAHEKGSLLHRGGQDGANLQQVPGGDAADGGVPLRVGQADLQRTVSAHGKAGDEVVLRRVRELGEHLPEQRGHLVGNVVKVGQTLDHVTVKTLAEHAGHHNSDAAGQSVALHVGVALPAGRIVAETEPENGDLAVLVPPHPAGQKILARLGQDDGGVGVHVQGKGVVVHLDARLEKFLLVYAVPALCV